MLKMIHVSSVIISISLFVLRGLWMMADSPRLQQRWVRIVPHLNDTILLISAVLLAIALEQYPLSHDWLTAKVIALLLYIGLGVYALKRAPSKTWRVVCWMLALATVAYIVMVALTRQPLWFI